MSPSTCNDPQRIRYERQFSYDGQKPETDVQGEHVTDARVSETMMIASDARKKKSTDENYRRTNDKSVPVIPCISMVSGFPEEILLAEL
jgi:hypothetical protein